MKTRTIRQSILIPAPPEAVYRALMTSKGHEAFTGAPARISPKVGGRFTAWGGYIHGSSLELVPPKRIVQAWRPSEDSWPVSHLSTVSYRLAEARGGTRITFVHSGVPADHAGHLAEGWKESYWEPLKTYFRGAQRDRAKR
ncbi:MAG TPA: SRPBCC family protein [Thermoplasmata archaeon]|nr:SRPBCC family protein [Thermoplasmata archaeon]